ncbi:unnamed protein product, partial [Clonostachys chloroleuca]
MDHIPRHQATDAYLTTSLSLVCVCLFVSLKFRHLWSREIWFVHLIEGWIMLELIALILFSLEYSRQVRLPQVLSSSVYIIVAIISLWGVALLQAIAIIYTFTIIINKEGWWKWLLVLECIEVVLAVILVMMPNIPAPLEFACMTTFTSQVASIGVLFIASRVMLSEKRIADHLLVLGLLVILVSTVVLVLSLIGFLTSAAWPQLLLNMFIVTVSYRLPASPRPASHIDGESELELAAHGLHDDSGSPH